jgi:phosphatidylinositol alpha-1,6-mannosyltransferase
VVIVGRMTKGRDKGHRNLIESWPAIMREQPQAILDIIGTGNDVDALRALAQDNGCSDNIHFHGNIDDSARDTLFAEACCLAMPSEGEGFGIVYIEAKRFGLPSIGASVDAAQEVIRHDEDGLIVPFNDPKRLAEAVLFFLNNREQAGQFGRNASRNWHEQYRFSAFRERFVKLVEQLAAESIA